MKSATLITLALITSMQSLSASEPSQGTLIQISSVSIFCLAALLFSSRKQMKLSKGKDAS